MTPQPQPRTSARLTVVGQILILLAAAWHIHRVNYVADDGFISFRYAQHLREGYGLVYNVGERVEGYTNFLWVILLAAAQWVSPALTLPQIARVSGSIAVLLSIALMFRFSRRAGLPSVVGLIGGAFVAAHSSVAAWAPAGLETSMFMLLVFAGAAALAETLRSARVGLAAPLLFALATMTRPDGMVFVLAALVAVAAAAHPRSFAAPELKRAAAPLVRFLLVFLLVYGPYFAWRTSYFGDLFPNTAYAKVGFSASQLVRGAKYIWQYTIDYGVFLWLVPVAAFLWRARQPWIWCFVWLIAAYLAYVLFVGGDGLAFHRFIAHVAPLMALVVAAALVDGYRRYVVPAIRAPFAQIVGVASLAILLGMTARTTLVPLLLPEHARWHEPQSDLWFPGEPGEHSYVWFDNYFVDRLAAAARYLEGHAAPGTLVAATPAGAIAFYMTHPVLDMLGLTDKHIARTSGVFTGGWQLGRAGHEKGDGAYVLSRAPDYILMGNVAVLPYPLTEQSMAAKLVLKSEHELWQDPDFHRRYELVIVRLADSGLFQYFSFYRKKG